MKTETSTSEVIACFHCGTPCEGTGIRLGDKSFCCAGCQTVYGILNENNLCGYYDLNTTPAQSPVHIFRKEKYAFLDDPGMIQKLILFTDGKETRAQFYLPQMHCSSCLWLLENLNRIHPGILLARVDFVQKQLYVVWDAGHTTLREVVEMLASVGYEPHLSLHQINGDKPVSYNRTTLYKIGIAGFCFSNIMMLSFPEYLSADSDMDPHLAHAFQYLSFALSIPVLFYAASGFFVSAWNGLRHRFLNIDAPIALAVLITFLRSAYEIFWQAGSGYLDSMSGIVFFMLVGRWLQDRTHARLSFDRDYRSFFPISISVLRGDNFRSVPVEEIKPNEVIRIYDGELVPVDGLLSQGKAQIDYSFVSGESVPVVVQPGEWVYAGGRQKGGAIELIVAREVSYSYLVSLWNHQVFKNRPSAPPSFIHIISTYFTYIVFALGIAAAGYWWSFGNSDRMWNAVTTVLIVACPCALLLSSTFTYGHILRIMAAKGIYFRSPEVIEQLAAANHVVFDKTGTITRQNEMQVHYSGKSLSSETLSAIKSVMAQSSHPLSRAIVRFLHEEKTISVREFKETPGKGIEAWINERYIKIGSPSFLGEQDNSTDSSSVVVAVDSQYMGTFYLSASWRQGIVRMLGALSGMASLSLLSGDRDYDRDRLQKWMSSSADLHFRQQPEDKLHFIESLQKNPSKRVLMVGDGLNDAGALRQSHVGIAIAENTNSFTPASDAIMDASLLHRLDALIDFARSGKKIILITFAFSVVYNIIGLYFALQGILSPVMAAVLMPASSITIMLLTWLLVNWFANRYIAKHDEGHIAG